MLTYQVRGRAFYFDTDERPTFPALAEVEFEFEPPIPFGGAIGESLTVKRGAEARLKWNANTGKDWAETQEPLDPVHHELRIPGSRLSFRGNVLTLRETVDNLKQLASRLESIYYGLPLLLNVDFIDSPIVTRVSGSLGGLTFAWGLARTIGRMDVTDTENQEKRITTAWDRFTLVSQPENRRLVAALGSYRLACRLARSGYAPHEFSAEVILNLAKTLEALFPPEPGQSIEAARNGLRGLGYSYEEAEARFIPALALRNQLDVGHVFLSLLEASQLAAVHEYVDRAEDSFRELLRRVMDGMQAGSFVVDSYDDAGPRRAVVEVINRISKSSPSTNDARRE